MIRASFAGLLSVAIVIVCGGLNPSPANAMNPVLSISFGLNRTNVEPGFTRFLVPADSGSIVNGIKIDMALTMPAVAGTWTPQWNSRDRTGHPGFTPIPTTALWYNIYRQELFARPGGIMITLTGLEPTARYQLEIWDYSAGSASDRIADVIANGDWCMTIQTNNANPPVTGEENHYTGTCTSDVNGVMVMELLANPNTVEQSGANNPYAIINAFRLTPINVSPIATFPVPQTASTIYTTHPRLQWEPGLGAISHNVYLGTDHNAVKNATQDTPSGVLVKQGIEPNSYDPGVLQAGTTYYWRIDEVKGSTIQTGNVWNFTIAPKTASNPSPVDGALFADPNFLDPAVILSWYQAADATSYHVYFGDNLQNVQAGTGGTDRGTRTDPNYSPGVMLEHNKTYYWRVDAFDGATTEVGAVWSFRTSGAGLGTVKKDIWENVTSGNVLTVLTNDTRYPDSPTVTQTLTSFDTGPDGYELADYGGRISGWLYVPLTGNYTFLLSSAGQGELWLSTDDDPANLMPQYIDREAVWGGLGGYAFSHSSDPIPLIGGNKYYIEALWVSVDWDYCQVAWQGAGIRDQQVIQGCYLSPYLPVNAYGASPANGAAGIERTPILGWKSGSFATQHRVFFGTDPNAVRNAGTSSPEYKGTKARGTESHDPGTLAFETTYYWRIDEVNSVNPASPWVGDVWSFTTGNFLVLDDFEGYTDDQGSRVFDVWIDGWGTQTNGSVVGYPNPNFDAGEHHVETIIIHSGRQSMPFSYNDDMKYSEAVRTLSGSDRDWTREGVDTLSLWFRGNPATVGSFVEGPVGTYTMRGSGADIAGVADEFHFAYKKLTGAGSIIVQVLSVSNTDAWAKAAVMIRETLAPGSKHAIVCVTPRSGVAFEGRTITDGEYFTFSEAGITAPHWVKLERSAVGEFTATHSADGVTWVPLQNVASQLIWMESETVYIGLAVTSHNANATCEARFSNVTMTGDVSADPWRHHDVGIMSNDAEPLYVVLNGTAVVKHEDSNAVLTNQWTEWRIPLQDFAAKGVNLTSVDSIGIGMGTPGNTTAPGGSGMVYFDDIRLYRPGGAAGQ